MSLFARNNDDDDAPIGPFLFAWPGRDRMGEAVRVASCTIKDAPPGVFLGAFVSFLRFARCGANGRGRRASFPFALVQYSTVACSGKRSAVDYAGLMSVGRDLSHWRESVRGRDGDEDEALSCIRSSKIPPRCVMGALSKRRGRGNGSKQ